MSAGIQRPRNERRGAAAVEAAFCLPVLLIFILGMWQVGRMIEISQILNNAAREGARYAAMGNIDLNGVITSITVAMVQQTVRDYLTGAGLPSTAINGATITLTNQSGNGWTNPSDAQPMDKFQVTVAIPSGAAYNSLQWSTFNFGGSNSLSASVTWASLVDSQITVGTQLPY